MIMHFIGLFFDTLCYIFIYTLQLLQNPPHVQSIAYDAATPSISAAAQLVQGTEASMAMAGWRPSKPPISGAWKTASRSEAQRSA